MKNEEIPESFRFVDLSDPRTWHYAPIQAWFDMHDSIAQKPPLVARNTGAREARQRALETFEEEESRTFDIRRFHNCGRQRARVQELFLQYVGMESSALETCSRWELEFMKVCGWLDSIEDEYANPNASGFAMRTILEMCAQKDEELNPYRSAAQAIRKESISETPRPNLPRETKGYLPGPIELMQLFRLTCLVAIELKPRISDAINLNLIPNEYGSAFECAGCKEKYDYGHAAEACCGIRYPKEARKIHLNSIPIGSPFLKRHVSTLLYLLWRFGYDTAVNAQELNEWDEWSSICDVGVSEFAGALLGKLFAANPETIRRKLVKPLLKAEYLKYTRITSQQHDYKNRNTIGRYAELRPPRWYVHEAPKGELLRVTRDKSHFIFKWRSSNDYVSSRFVSSLIRGKTTFESEGHE